MRPFEAPEIEIIKFEVEDIITTSGDSFDDSDTGIWS